MTDPENFLSRWARKKRDAVEDAASEPGVSASASPPADAFEAQPSVSPEGKKTPETAFDPASLPPLESIGAQTDIRAFLQAGVPPGLVRAALRRAWTADPAIRNFKGLQENDWDFNDPNSMFGFGELGPDFDVNRMLASMFGEAPKETESTSTADEVTPDSSPVAGEETVITNRQQAECAKILPGINNGTAKGLNSGDATSSDTAAGVSAAELVTDAATQQGAPAPATTPSIIRTRRHGGALPR